jgi:hypothetical protein
MMGAEIRTAPMSRKPSARPFPFATIRAVAIKGVFALNNATAKFRRCAYPV